MGTLLNLYKHLNERPHTYVDVGVTSSGGDDGRKRGILDTAMRRLGFMALRSGISVSRLTFTVMKLLVSGAKPECFLVRLAFMTHHGRSRTTMNADDVTSLSRILVERRKEDIGSFADEIWEECANLSAYLLPAHVVETHGTYVRHYIPDFSSGACRPENVLASVAWFLAGVRDGAYVSPLFSAIVEIMRREAEDTLSDAEYTKTVTHRAVRNVCVDQLRKLKEACPSPVFSVARNQHFGDAEALGVLEGRPVSRAYVLRDAACRVMTCLTDGGVHGQKDARLLEWVLETSALFQSRSHLEAMLRTKAAVPSRESLRRALVYVAWGSVAFKKTGFCVSSALTSLRAAGAPWHERDDALLHEMLGFFELMSPSNPRFHGVYTYMFADAADAPSVRIRMHVHLSNALTHAMIPGRPGRRVYLVHSLLPLMDADLMRAYGNAENTDRLRKIRERRVDEIQKRIEESMMPPFEGGVAYLRSVARFTQRRGEK